MQENDIRHFPLRVTAPRRGACPICGVRHDAGQPHYKNSVYYLRHYAYQHGRLPTWEDAMAHCTEETQGRWRAKLAFYGIDPGDTDGQRLDTAGNAEANP